MTVQISVTSEGGSSTLALDLSIEAYNLKTAQVCIKNSNIPTEYGPESESCAVRGFLVRDPFGKLVNVLQLDKHCDLTLAHQHFIRGVSSIQNADSRHVSCVRVQLLI